MADSILAESHSAASNRRAVVCDEGESVWFYLTDIDGQALVAGCWLFNTITAPPDLSGFTGRDCPPPAPSAFAKVVPNAQRQVETRWLSVGQWTGMAHVCTSMEP